jgi:Tol biopolymer transport system component
MKALAWVCAAAIGALGGSPVVDATSFTTVSQMHSLQLGFPSVSLSGDGRFVAFSSNAALVAADTNEHTDIYVLDRSNNNQVTLESERASGRPFNTDSDRARLNHDGRVLIYETDGHVLLKNRREETTTLLAAGHDASISGDGRFVVFTSSATAPLTSRDADGPGEDLYLLELQTRLLKRIPVTNQGSRLSVGSVQTSSMSSSGRGGPCERSAYAMTSFCCYGYRQRFASALEAPASAASMASPRAPSSTAPTLD